LCSQQRLIGHRLPVRLATQSKAHGSPPLVTPHDAGSRVNSYRSYRRELAARVNVAQNGPGRKWRSCCWVRLRCATKVAR
jgi:hypothetical protein